MSDFYILSIAYQAISTGEQPRTTNSEFVATPIHQRKNPAQVNKYVSLNGHIQAIRKTRLSTCAGFIG